MTKVNVSATVGMSATVGEMSATVGEMSATVGEMSETVGKLNMLKKCKTRDCHSQVCINYF